MVTKQPAWKIVGNLGDVDYITHGGALVHEDQTGVYAPELEVIVPEPEGTTGWTIYRFNMDKCTYINGVLSDNKFHPEQNAWFADKVEDVANSMGEDADTLRNWLCSDNTMERAMGYNSLVEYFGLGEFDYYPFTIETKEEMENRYPD